MIVMRPLYFAALLVASITAGTGSLASVEDGQAATRVVEVENLPEGEGRELTKQLCTQCHAIGMVTSQRHSKAEWGSVIDQMVDDQGLSASDEDLEEVLTYLTENFGKAGNGAEA